MTDAGTFWIAVFCGARAGKSDAHLRCASLFGEAMAVRGVGIVFGGDDKGLMGAVARGALAHGGKVKGVLPTFLADRALTALDGMELITVASLEERIDAMLHIASACVALPGGIGTVHELVAVLALAHLRLHRKPCVMLSANGVFDHLQALFERLRDEEFMSGSVASVARTLPELIEWVDQVRSYPADMVVL